MANSLIGNTYRHRDTGKLIRVVYDTRHAMPNLLHAHVDKRVLTACEIEKGNYKGEDFEITEEELSQYQQVVV
jgi:hypothetical protein